VWNATQISHLALTTSVITRSEASQTSLDAAQAAGLLDDPSARAAVEAAAAAEEEEDSPTTPLAKCTPPFAPSAARTQKCPSDLAEIARFTATTASADAGPAAPSSSRP